jgi:hypothetical protein
VVTPVFQHEEGCLMRQSGMLHGKRSVGLHIGDEAMYIIQLKCVLYNDFKYNYFTLLLEHLGLLSYIIKTGLQPAAFSNLGKGKFNSQD